MAFAGHQVNLKVERERSTNLPQQKTTCTAASWLRNKSCPTGHLCILTAFWHSNHRRLPGAASVPKTYRTTINVAFISLNVQTVRLLVWSLTLLCMLCRAQGPYLFRQRSIGVAFMKIVALLVCGMASQRSRNTDKRRREKHYHKQWEAIIDEKRLFLQNNIYYHSMRGADVVFSILQR